MNQPKNDKLKETQRELTISENKYREIIENIEDGYFEVDLKGNYTYVNDYISRYLGISKEELIGRSYTDFVEKDTVGEVFKTFNKVYKNNLPKGIFESQIKRNNGEIRTFEGSFYLKYDSSGRKVGFYGFTRDITKKKEAELKLRKSEENLRSAYNQVNFYKDLLSHDIANILNTIRMSLEIHPSYLEIPEKRDEIINLIRISLDKGMKLFANIKKLSQLEDSEIILEKINVLKILEQSINFIKRSFNEKEIQINVNTSGKQIVVRANNLLLDAFENLLINAVKYNDNSTVEILVNISKERKDRKIYIKMEFVDNGIGISDERKQFIFQRGYNMYKGGKGMGFGLSLVKKIIQKYRGEIWVEDSLKGDYTKGAKFVLLIPEIE